MHKLTFALCSYNRAERLEKLIPVMKEQACPIPFEILIIDNNSTDNTREVVGKIASQDGPVVRYAFEKQQGIPYARNRAIEESIDSDYMVFIDDDEIPVSGLLEGAVDALQNESAQCAGGKVTVLFDHVKRPKWLGDELLGFLAEIDHGDTAFWIKDTSTPIWTANVAYDMRIFREHSDLRFDLRYNRQGNQVGGGSDAMMFREMLQRGIRLRYRPDMVVNHYVDDWRLKRIYFLKLHFVAGRKQGQYKTGVYDKQILGIPRFMFRNAVVEWVKTMQFWLQNKPGTVRQAMNGAYALGLIRGCYLRYRHGNNQS